jgi:peptidoglycan hydrolase CwlO-like protein
MKTKILFVLGAALWIFFFTSIAAGSYLRAHANAAEKQAGLQSSVASLQNQVNAVQSSLRQSASNNKEACLDLQKVQAQITKYKLNITVPMPKECAS